MKWIFLLAGMLCVFACSYGQFPTTDSLHRFNNRYIGNSAVEAFGQKRLNTLLHGIIQFIDTARAGGGGAIGVDTLYAVNDSTVRYKKNGVDLFFISKGIYDFRRKVDTAFAFNDSIVRFKINGTNRDVLIRGKDVRKINDTTIIIGVDSIKVGGSGGKDSIDILSLKRSGKLYTRNPIANRLSQLRTIPTAELDSGFIYSLKLGHQVGDFYYDPLDNYSVDDSVTVITTTDGKRFKRFIDGEIYVDWWYRNGDVDDAASFQRMFDWIGAGANRTFKIKAKKTEYLINTQINLPKILPAGLSPQPFLEIDMPGVTIKTDSAITIFDRIPISGDNISGMIGSYKPVINGIYFRGPNLFGSAAIKLGATYGSVISNCHFQSFDTAIVHRFSLKGLINNCFFTTNKSVAILGASGEAWGQGISESAFNDNIINHCRVFNASGAFAAIKLEGQDQTNVYDFISEGNKAQYDIHADYQGSTSSLSLYLEKIWLESVGSPNTAFYLRTNGLTSIKNVRIISPDTLFHVPIDVASGARFLIEDIPNAGSFGATIFNTDGSSLSGRSFQFKNFGDPNTTTLPLDPNKWVGGVMPMVTVEGMLVSGGGRAVLSSGQFTFGGAYNSSRYSVSEGGILFGTDNDYYFGGIGPTNARPYRGYFGTGGLYIDTSGRLYWGQAGPPNPDVSLSRINPGQLGVRNFNDDFRDLKAQRFSATRPSGYDTLFATSDLGPLDWPTYSQVIDLIANYSPAPAFNHGLTLIGNPSDPVIPLDVDTTIIATKNDLANVSINAVDSLADNGAGDSIKVLKKGEHLYSISKAPPGAGITSVSTDGNFTGNGNTTPITLDTTIKIATKWDLSQIPTAPLPAFFSGAGINITGNDVDGYTWTNTGATGTNPHKAYSLFDFGGVANATTPPFTNFASGTNNTPAWNNMLASVPDGSLCIVPPGNWLFSTVPDTIKGPKRIYILILGTTYHNGKDFWVVTNGSGGHETHYLDHRGIAIGRTNMPAHTSTTVENGTGPDFEAFTGSFVKVYNAYQQHISLNKVEGFECAIDEIGETRPGQLPEGCQENWYFAMWLYKNKVAFRQRSLNGFSYNDKATVKVMRASGKYGYIFDGYEPAVTVSGVPKQWNGSSRSNYIEIMFEQVNTVARVYGDANYNDYIWRIEGGGMLPNGRFTNLFADTTISFLSTGPTPVRNNRIAGPGYLSTTWIDKGMGINNIIDKPIFYKSTDFLSMRSEVDGQGKIRLYVDERINSFKRSQVPADSFIFVNRTPVQGDSIITATAFTIPDNINHVYASSSGTTITMPSANNAPDRIIYIYSRGNFTTTVSGSFETGSPTTITAYRMMAYQSKFGKWYAQNPNSGAGGGGGGDASTNTSTSVIGEAAVFSDNLGKTLKRFVGTGFVKATNGVLSVQSGINTNDINATGGSSTSYLRKDGTWSDPAGSGTGYWTLNGSDIYRDSRVGVGPGITAPTARFQIAGNSAGTANYAPLKIGTGLLTVPENNVFGENDGNNWYATLNNTRQMLLTDRNISTVITNIVHGRYHQENDANLTVQEGDYTCYIFGMTADRTITLPDPALYPNRVIIIGRWALASGFPKTVYTSRSYYVGNSPVGAIAGDNATITLQSTGTRWQMISTN